MIVGADIINLSGDHPYYRELGTVALGLPILSRVPGTEVTDRNTTGVDTRRAEDAWSPLAGPYLTIPGSRVSRDQAIVDRRALLGLVWDLRGEPIHPSLGRRAPVEFAAVMEMEGWIVIWRRTREMFGERDAKLNEIRSVVPLNVNPRRDQE